MISIWKPLSAIVAFFFILSFTACKPKTTERLTYFANSQQVSRRYHMVNDKIEGVMTEYYPDGKVRMERLFQNGVQTGRTVLYHPDGKLKEAQYFENGLQQGGDTLWYPDGRVQFVMNFKDGKKDGYLRKWSPDGVMFLEVRYEMDSLKEVKREMPPQKPAENQ